MKRKISIRTRVLMIFMLLVAIRFFVPTWTPSIKGYENSISILKQIEINGSKHEVMIRGNDKKNPVLLFVHGGPGCPEIYYVRKYQDLLEQNFTIVRYDQRGAGKSYHLSEDYSNLSINLLVDDLIALTDYVRNELETDEIVLVGHSFGTIVGIKAAYQAPEKFKSYIGIGQVGDFWAGELEALEYCLAQATAKNKSSDIKAIEAYRENTSKHLEQFPRKYVWKYGGAVRLINEKVDMVTGLLFNPEYNLSDSIGYAKGLLVSDHKLWKEILQSNLPQEVPELKIPCYFVTGKYDHLTPIKTANHYFNTIIAPTKEFVVFDNSAHFPQFEEKENFFTFINSSRFFIQS